MATQWKKVETGGSMDRYWPGKAADRTEGMSVTGTYVRKHDTRRPDGSDDHVWVLKDEEGKMVGVNSAAGLNRAMETITEGSLIRITFLGKKMGNNGRQFNDFQVDVAETADADNAKEDDNKQVNLEDIPF